MKPVRVVEHSEIQPFEDECAELLKKGYVMMSANCGFIDSERYEFCSQFQAIFRKPTLAKAHLVEQSISGERFIEQSRAAAATPLLKGPDGV